jgi:hypothetical protein
VGTLIDPQSGIFFRATWKKTYRRVTGQERKDFDVVIDKKEEHRKEDQAKEEQVKPGLYVWHGVLARRGAAVGISQGSWFFSPSAEARSLDRDHRLYQGLWTSEMGYRHGSLDIEFTRGDPTNYQLP